MTVDEKSGRDSVHVYPHWGYDPSAEGPSGVPPPIEKFCVGSTALVLESLESVGGNGCRVMMMGQRQCIGWVYLGRLKKLNDDGT